MTNDLTTLTTAELRERLNGIADFADQVDSLSESDTADIREAANRLRDLAARLRYVDAFMIETETDAFLDEIRLGLEQMADDASTDEFLIRFHRFMEKSVMEPQEHLRDLTLAIVDAPHDPCCPLFGRTNETKLVYYAGSPLRPNGPPIMCACWKQKLTAYEQEGGQ